MRIFKKRYWLKEVKEGEFKLTASLIFLGLDLGDIYRSDKTFYSTEDALKKIEELETYPRYTKIKDV
jgi:hypothetical protein